MKIYLAEHRGFCYGVKRAVELAEANASSIENIYTLGPIIHNPQVVSRLADKGVMMAENLSEIQSGKVIIRSHGVGPKVYEEARARNLLIVDATCPHVKRAQRAAAELLAQDYKVVVIGERCHPEVKSIVEWSDNTATVIETSEEAYNMPYVERLGVVVQTTFAADDFNAIVKILKTKCDELKVEKTICNATEARQKAAIALARDVDVMVVVGGKNSANTTRLAELCLQVCDRVYHIETAAEIQAAWFIGAKIAGVTAGASTPDWIIEEVVGTMEQLEQSDCQGIFELKPGAIVKGKVVSLRTDEVFVDIGYKAEGIIAKAELAYPAPENVADIVKEGDVIDVLVLDVENNDGNPKLSKVRADKIMAWDKLETVLAEKQTVEVKVTEVVKGGLAVAVSGLRGFIPASQIDLRFIDELTQFIGKTFEVLPIEINKEKNRLVLSRRAVLEAERRRAEEELYAKLVVNQELKGTVTRLASFGAFVDIGGVEGLIHISDLSWERVKSPSEVVKVGDEVRVTVLKVDPKAKKLSLGLKQMSRDPWFDVVDKLTEGMIINGEVSKLTKFGAFLKIDDNIEGLVHISEISDRRITSAADVLKVGQEVRAKVIGIDKGNKRIALSIIKAQEDAERAEYRNYLNSQEKQMSVTLGEKFGHLFKCED